MSQMPSLDQLTAYFTDALSGLLGETYHNALYEATKENQVLRDWRSIALDHLSVSYCLTEIVDIHNWTGSRANGMGIYDTSLVHNIVVDERRRTPNSIKTELIKQLYASLDALLPEDRSNLQILYNPLFEHSSDSELHEAIDSLGIFQVHGTFGNDRKDVATIASSNFSDVLPGPLCTLFFSQSFDSLGLWHNTFQSFSLDHSETMQQHGVAAHHIALYGSLLNGLENELVDMQFGLETRTARLFNFLHGRAYTREFHEPHFISGLASYVGASEQEITFLLDSLHDARISKFRTALDRSIDAGGLFDPNKTDFIPEKKLLFAVTESGGFKGARVGYATAIETPDVQTDATSESLQIGGGELKSFGIQFFSQFPENDLQFLGTLYGSDTRMDHYEPTKSRLNMHHVGLVMDVRDSAPYVLGKTNPSDHFGSFAKRAIQSLHDFLSDLEIQTAGDWYSFDKQRIFFSYDTQEPQQEILSALTSSFPKKVEQVYYAGGHLIYMHAKKAEHRVNLASIHFQKPEYDFDVFVQGMKQSEEEERGYISLELDLDPDDLFDQTVLDLHTGGQQDTDYQAAYKKQLAPTMQVIFSAPQQLCVADMRPDSFVGSKAYFARHHPQLTLDETNALYSYGMRLAYFTAINREHANPINNQNLTDLGQLLPAGGLDTYVSYLTSYFVNPILRPIRKRLVSSQQN